MAVLLLVAALSGALFFGAKTYAQLRGVRKRFASVLDIDREIVNVRDSLATARQQLGTTREQYGAAKATYDRLLAEVSSLEDTAQDISVGLYKPQFNYDTTEAYRAKMLEVRERQKRLVRDELAVSFGVAWTIGNSRKEGERMQKQYGKLLLRAFNGETDAAVAKVSWDNVTRMEERIRKAFEAINKLGGVMHIALTEDYRSLKLDELRLEHELEEKRRTEAEEQRRIREQMRDEEKAERELERAQREAEEDEARQSRALDKARTELAKATGARMAALTEKVAELELALRDAHAAKERAKSMAEQTKRGHVYIISNHGSFGTDVIKIGMTRRLDPHDRVRELGDASVPFGFDVHAMIFSEDAPALENALHREFSKHRVNLVNTRKEFFRVALADLESYARNAGLQVKLTLLAEAREYRETLARRAANDNASNATSLRTDRFPAAL